MPDTDTYVLDATGAKVRTFLYGLAEGTTDYRSLHNLTEQVEHQYHGRFLVELIQNAHDQLPDAPPGGQQSARIDVVLTGRRDPRNALHCKRWQAVLSVELRQPFQLGSERQGSASLDRAQGHRLSQCSRDNGCPGDLFETFAGRSGFRRVLFRVLAGGDLPAVRTDRRARKWETTTRRFHSVRRPWWTGRREDAAQAAFKCPTARGTGGQTVSQWLQAEMKYLSAYTLPFPLVDRACHCADSRVRTAKAFDRHPLSTEECGGTCVSHAERLTALQQRDLSVPATIVVPDARLRGWPTATATRRQQPRRESAFMVRI